MDADEHNTGETATVSSRAQFQRTFDSKLRGEASAPTVWGRAKNGHGIP